MITARASKSLGTEEHPVTDSRGTEGQFDADELDSVGVPTGLHASCLYLSGYARGGLIDSGMW
jgi:hypothetical protein